MSKKNLIIVESPAKAKTINKYLGSGYIVEASVGHIKDLIKVRLGVDIDNGFKPEYTTIKGKAQIIKRLKQLSEMANNVLIATDPDREGEAIAWHIADEVKEKNKNVKRVLFNEITKSGIQKGISQPRDLDEKLFMSQQARRVMDRLIGYQVSPFVSQALIDKTSKALSAGRVQSVALKLICEREDEIQSFLPIEYWSINGLFRNDDENQIKAKLIAFENKLIKNPEGSAKANNPELQNEIDQKLKELHFIKNKEQAEELVKKIKSTNFSIESITKKQIKRTPPTPFTTSLLQQEASKRLGFPGKKTMQLAQILYEGVSIGSETVGLITYMRTDSTRISPEAIEAAKQFIIQKYGRNYYPEQPNIFHSKTTNVQDAHEAIRPTTITYTPEEVKKHLTKDLADLYELIFDRFIASQMKPATIEQTTINITGNGFKFRATGSVILFKGFLAAYDDLTDNGNSDKDENTILPEGLKESQQLDLIKVDSIQSQTKAPPRYTESSLIKKLDELGIGRPSTYTQIISTLSERGYVDLNKKAFVPTELGQEVNSILVKHFPNIFNVDFTAQMEQELDDIAEGTKSYLTVLKNFYEPFKATLNEAENKAIGTQIQCPKCGSPMQIKVSRRGRFLGCTRYPECDGTMPLPKGTLDIEQTKEPEIAEGIFCSCGKPMVIREGKFGKFYGCSGYPECKEIKPISSGVTCPKCNEGSLIERFSPKTKKKFWGCSNYPKCDFLTNYEPINQKCPKCEHYYLEYRYRKINGGYEKYINCPHCRQHFEISEFFQEQE